MEKMIISIVSIFFLSGCSVLKASSDYDPITKDTFWRAEGVNTLKSLDTPQERTEYTNEVLHEMLKEYPINK